MTDFNTVYDDELAEEQALIERMATAEVAPSDLEARTPKVGRPPKVEPIKLVAWRQAHKASIADTAKRWHVSEATVKRLCRQYGEAAELERQRWQCEQLDRELQEHEYAYRVMFLRQRSQHLYWAEFGWLGACERAKGTAQEDTVRAARDAALATAERQFNEDWSRSMGPIPG